MVISNGDVFDLERYVEIFSGDCESAYPEMFKYIMVQSWVVTKAISHQWRETWDTRNGKSRPRLESMSFPILKIMARISCGKSEVCASKLCSALRSDFKVAASAERSSNRARRLCLSMVISARRSDSAWTRRRRSWLIWRIVREHWFRRVSKKLFEWEQTQLASKSLTKWLFWKRLGLLEVMVPNKHRNGWRLPSRYQ